MEKDINEVLQTRRLTYFGHVTRMEKDRYPNILMHGYRRGRQPTGRPRKRWQDNITEDCEELNLTIYQASHLANDRVKWRNTVGNKGCRSAGRGHRLRRRRFKSSKSKSVSCCKYHHPYRPTQGSNEAPITFLCSYVNCNLTLPACLLYS